MLEMTSHSSSAGGSRVVGQIEMTAQNSVRFPVLRPLLPTAEKLLPYLRQIDAGRWYTNYGPLLREFEAQVARHFAVDRDQLATSANATLAIAQTLRALGAQPGSLCVMPSWTFVATPAAAVWAGLRPYFVDVDPDSWTIRRDQVSEIARSGQVGAVIVVSAFGAPLDLAVWDEFTRSTGIGVLVDAAAGFDGFAGFGDSGHKTPVAISLHATKVSGIGEGAVVVSGDSALARRIRDFGNFGFHGDRDAGVPGINAKMSEYAAASGLAMLGEWPERRNAWAALTQIFAQELEAAPELRRAPGFGDGWISSYGLVELPAWASARGVADVLRRSGVETRQWWGEGCHRQSAYRDCERAVLSETERLGERVLGLPFWIGLTREDIAEVFRALRAALRPERRTSAYG
jgi:dTDP-4-amino-4,6-dideoxygalactose transaminase